MVQGMSTLGDMSNFPESSPITPLKAQVLKQRWGPHELASCNLMQNNRLHSAVEPIHVSSVDIP